MAGREAKAGRPASSSMALSSIGICGDVAHVALQADQEHLASELAQRYGDAVDLVVGAFRYPSRRPAHQLAATRPPPEIVSIEGLKLHLRLEEHTLAVGARGQAKLVVSNIGSRHLGPLSSEQPLLARVVDGAGETVGGLAPAWIAGTGLGIDLDPGKELAIAVPYGTASFREDLGYLLPPGRYWLSVIMPFRRGHGGGTPAQAVAAPLEELTILPTPAGDST